MTGDRRLQKKLKAFSARARSVAPACINEAHTRASLVDPYLKILGYDVSDPSVCRLEYGADFGQGRAKVDYAIMRDKSALMLIEAKAAIEDFSEPLEAPRQLQLYFSAEDVEFAALTNGLVWQWYWGLREGRLRKTPFLVHDVQSPGTKELPWLRIVSKDSFDAESARNCAEETSIAPAILDWIEETRRRPSEDVLGIIIKEKLGAAYTPQLERVRQSFITQFDAYICREFDLRSSATGKQQGREQKNGEDPPGNVIRGTCAWRVKGEEWQACPNGRDLLIAVMRHLASIDARGRLGFYDGAITASGNPMFSDHNVKAREWRQVEPDIDKFVRVHLGYDAMRGVIAQACRQCRPANGASVQLGEDIEIRLGTSR